MKADSKRTLFLMCAAACCGSVVSKEPETQAVDSIPVLESRDDAMFKFDVGWSVDSKFMNYGLVDNKDPIVTPHASVVFMDWLGLGVSAIFDTTKYGRKAGYSNRGGKYTELDPEVSLTHGFSPDDYGFLPTTVEFSLAYMYEYHPRAMGGGTGEPGDDTQFVTLQVALPDLWLEPIATFERDIDRDDGTYVNLEVGHAFAIVEGGKGGDAVLTFRPSIAQGLGTTRRTRGYGLAEDHGGLMDMCIKGEFEWKITESVTLTTYLAYADYVFDATLREAARHYEAHGRNRTSYNFITGLALCASF